MKQKFDEAIMVLLEQGKTYPKMWTNDVIRLVTHLRDVVYPKEPETVHGNEAEKAVCNHVYVVDSSISVTQMKCCKCGNMKPISFT